MTSTIEARGAAGSGLKGGALAFALAAATILGTVAPVGAAAIGSGQAALSAAHAAPVTEAGYWYRGRWYGGCWGCAPPPSNNGAAVGAGIALGILGAAAIAGAASAPPPPVYYAPPPRVYVVPETEVYLEGPPPPRPRSCWVNTGPGGAGYWSPC